MQTTKFKAHYVKHHLDAGEEYVTAHRERYERALLDPNLLEFGDDGPLKAVFVASLVRISHYLQDISERVAAMETARVDPAPVESATESPPTPTPPTTTSRSDENVEDTDQSEGPPSPAPARPTRQRRAATGSAKTRKKRKTN